MVITATIPPKIMEGARGGRGQRGGQRGRRGRGRGGRYEGRNFYNHFLGELSERMCDSDIGKETQGMFRGVQYQKHTLAASLTTNMLLTGSLPYYLLSFAPAMKTVFTLFRPL